MCYYERCSAPNSFQHALPRRERRGARHQDQARRARNRTLTGHAHYVYIAFLLIVRARVGCENGSG